MSHARKSLASWMVLPLAASAAAAATASTPAAPKHVTCTLIAEQTAAAPNSTVTLGIDLKIEKKWHVYSNLRNDNGFPPNAEWTLPAGFTVDPIQWPAPVRHVDPGDLLNHVYFDHVTLPVTLHVPATAQPGTTALIKATVKWLVCDASCVGEDADVEIKLPITKPGDPAPAKSPDARKIEEARAKLAKSIADRKIEVEWRPKSVLVTAAGASRVEFYPDDTCVPFASPVKEPVADGPRITITLGDPEPDHTTLSGVLMVRPKPDAPAEWFIIKSDPKAARPGSPTPPKADKPAS